jgi:hypothetical protein
VGEEAQNATRPPFGFFNHQGHRGHKGTIFFFRRDAMKSAQFSFPIVVIARNCEVIYLRDKAIHFLQT